MRFVLYDHAGKGLYLRQRLLEAGHTPTQNADELDVLLVDCDWPWAYPRPQLIQSAKNHGAKVVTYPHGGWPTSFVYDGIAEPDLNVDMRLEHGVGSIELTDAFTSDDLGQRATGWLYSPTEPFTPGVKPRKVLFAPLHPNMEALAKGLNGHDPAPRINREVYRRLLELPGIDLTVSVVGPDWKNGLWAHPRARFEPNPAMVFHHSYEQIRAHDLVVATGTMLVAAVALGKPTVGFCQDLFYDYVDGQYIDAHNKNRYADLVRYPLDADDAPLADLFGLATGGPNTVGEWRERWCGTDGTTTAVELLEQLVGPPAMNVTVEGVTARAGARL